MRLTHTHLYRQFLSTAMFSLLVFLCTFVGACSEKSKLASVPGLVPSAPIKYKLNDTGITYGGDYPLGVNETCTGVVDPEHVWAKNDQFLRLNYRGQDCEQGRDVDFPNNDDGFAGFSYQKISPEGKPLPLSAPEWSCVVDRVSGLMWEVKTPGNSIKGDSDLHDADDVFSWYNNDWALNGGSVGKWGKQNNLCSGYSAGDTTSYCNTESFVARVNKSHYCSYDDWRLPTLEELSSLINYGTTEPAIDIHFFPNTQQAPYWSVSSIASSNEQARYVNFRFGQIIWSIREEPFRVRLVREVK